MDKRNHPSDIRPTADPALRALYGALMALALLGLALAIAVDGAGATPRPRAAGIVDLPVSFHVRNANTSRLGCPSDGARYTVRGRLVAPSAALAGAGPRAVTVYVHGFNFGGVSTFDLRVVPAYDYAAKMAGLGQTSL